jgi:asparagine synthase (glutamine-hydrolysing)
MFAFALFDRRNQLLLLARDRLGKKPLYYALTEGRLIFGSEIKALLAAEPGLRATLNHQALMDYFNFGYIPHNLSAFEAIYKLPPGHLAKYEKGQLKISRYWDLPRYGTHSPNSEEECLEELEHRLEEAVRLRLISDVPLGALLSGGVDSSTVVALMARASKQVKTFSIGFRKSDFNEASYASMVARTFSTDHYELILDPDVLATLDTLASSLEEPFGDSSMLPTYYVSALARKNVTVALAGDGGDEIFAGYDRYAIHARRQKFEKVPKSLGGFYRRTVYPWLPRNMRGRKFLYNVSLPGRERYVDMISLLPSFERNIPLLSKEFRERAGQGRDPLEIMFRFFDEAPADDDLSRIQYVDTKTYLVDDILAKVDRMSMANSLEVRAPLLDHVVVEWVTGLNPNWKLRDGASKYILKKVAEKIGVPREVLYRPKRGFSIPLVHWLRNELKELVSTVLLESRTMQRGYFNAEGVRQLLSEHFCGRRDHSDGIWRLLMFELWHRKFLEVGRERRPEAVGASISSEPERQC